MFVQSIAPQKSKCDLCHTVRRTIIRHQTSNTRTKKRTKAAAPQTNPINTNPTIDLSTVQLIRKKKRKADANAGLRIPTVAKIGNTSTASVTACVKHTTSIVSKQPAAHPLKQLKSASQTHASNHKTKNDSKKAAGKATPQQQKGIKALSAAAKKAADAKQRNSMLLLANVLKMKDAEVKRPTGLEIMLRK